MLPAGTYTMTAKAILAPGTTATGITGWFEMLALGCVPVTGGVMPLKAMPDGLFAEGRASFMMGHVSATVDAPVYTLLRAVTIWAAGRCL